MTTLALGSALVLGGGGLVSLLIWLLVLAIVCYVVFLILGMLPIPQPIKTIVCLILGLIFLLVLLGHLGFAL